MVWWYNGLYKNHIEHTSPKVLVTFRVLSDDGCSLSQYSKYCSVPLTLLGKLRIGSVWHHGQLTHTARLDERTLDVSFDEDSWNFTSSKIPYDGRAPYPNEIHPFWHGRHDSWLVEFKLQDGGYLVIPCLEIFTRLYGRSQEIKRVLATYPWQGISNSAQARLLPPTEEHEAQGLWKVKLPERLVQGDAPFLANLKYNRYTRAAAQSIHAQIEANFQPASKTPLFLQIKPWFQGPARLKVRGYSYGQSFLGLQILGCSEPIGLPIVCIRDILEAKDEGESSQTKQISINQNNSFEESTIHITGNQAPDRDAGMLNLLEEAFETLGDPLEITHIRKVSQRPSTLPQSAKRNEQKSATISDADPYGTGKKIMRGSIHAPQAMESSGALRDIWNAIHERQRRSPESVTNIRWFTFKDGFQSAQEPKLITLRPINDKNPETDIRNWVYVDVKAKALRGALVMRADIDGQTTFFLEIQRRTRTITGSVGKIIESEENLKGLIFRLDNPNDLRSWLSRILSDIRFVKGIASKLTHKCPGLAAAFSHTTNRNKDTYLFESALNNALSKLQKHVIH